MIRMVMIVRIITVKMIEIIIMRMMEVEEVKCQVITRMVMIMLRMINNHPQHYGRKDK